MEINDSIKSRFDSKVIKTDGCWIWNSAFTTRGYGFFWVGGKKRSEYAHRVAWQLASGTGIPSGMHVLHSCDNPKCVNPEHLSIGSAKDNVADCVLKKRHAFGSRNGGGKKLTEESAASIKHSKGEVSIRNASLIHGVSLKTVKHIRNGRLWRHV